MIAIKWDTKRKIIPHLHFPLSPPCSCFFSPSLLICAVHAYSTQKRLSLPHFCSTWKVFFSPPPQTLSSCQHFPLWFVFEKGQKIAYEYRCNQDALGLMNQCQICSAATQVSVAFQLKQNSSLVPIVTSFSAGFC